MLYELRSRVSAVDASRLAKAAGASLRWYQKLAAPIRHAIAHVAAWCVGPLLLGSILVWALVTMAGAHRVDPLVAGGGVAAFALLCLFSDVTSSEVPLMWMVNRARACGLEFKPDHFVPRPAPKQPTDEELLARGVGEWVCPDPFGPDHPSLKGPYKWFATVLGANARPIGGAGAEKRDTEFAGEHAASSAIERLSYSQGQPANLLAWRVQHKEAIDVLSEAAELVDPWPRA